MPYIILIIYLVAAVALQLLAGDFPVPFFSFPLNVILEALWLIFMAYIWKYHRKSIFTDFMLSRGATLWALVMLLMFCLLIGMTDMRSLVGTWIFIAVLLYFQTVLLFVILRGWRMPTATGARSGPVRWRFLFNHVGLLLVVSSAFWGAPDSQTLRVQAFIGQPVDEAFMEDGTSARLHYEIEVKSFDVETYDNGVPSMFKALAVIDGKEVELRVNKPYPLSLSEDIYLSGYDAAVGAKSGYCVLQVVREPWKYGVVAGIILMLTGAFMMFAGGPRRSYGEDD